MTPGRRSPGHGIGLVAVSGWLLLAAAACSGRTRSVSLGPPRATYDSGDYEWVLRRWTRSARTLNLRYLDTPLRADATCLAPDFIAAYAARYQSVFDVPRAEAARIAGEMNATWARSYAFLFAAATTQDAWNDFSRPESIWRIALANDRKQQVAPLEVKAERKLTEATTAFFPYIGHFHRAYRLTFPRQLPDGTPLIRPDTRYMVLHIAGPLGSTSLVWKLK